MTRTHLFLLIVVAFAAGCQIQAQPDPTTTEQRTPVRTAPVVEETRALPIRTSGRLVAKMEMKLAFKTGGFIQDLVAEEGQRVQANQRLASLNLDEINAQVTQAERAAEKAVRDLARVEALYGDSVTTLAQVQDARTALDVAEANVDVATFNRKHSEIYAPVVGKILKRFAEANEFIAPGQPIFLLSAQGKGHVVRVGIADRDVVRVRLGDAATLHFDAFPNQTFTGRVTEIAESADPFSGTFEVEIAVVDRRDQLKSGFIAKVDLTPSVEETFHFIPIEALTEGNGDAGTVFGVDPERQIAQKIPIRIAHILDTEIAVQDGLQGISHVVTEGAPYLSEGSNILIIDS